MNIYSKSQIPTTPASSQVKRIGKYLYNHIDSAYKFKSSSNEYDVYFTVYYQRVHPTLGIGVGDIQEMNIDINITTYQNKIRVNIIEMNPDEWTIGHKLYRPELLENLEEAMNRIWLDIVKLVSKTYKEYDFIF